MNYLSIENLSKSYGDKTLFKDISFGIQKGEKVAIVAKNGSGKSTLMRILMGYEIADTGEFSFRNGIRVGFLNQDPKFEGVKTVGEAVLQSDNPILSAVRLYSEALENPEDYSLMEKALVEMDNMKAWDYETRINQILTRFEVGKLGQDVHTLSGGQRKRVALAQLLIDEPDFLILDEPTNHLDLEMIEWLEEYLGQNNKTLFMVTHDRYFLERVCNQIIELDEGNLYHYPGNYSLFLEKKDERAANDTQTVEKARNLMRKELDWVRRQPKARGTKAKYRLDAFEEIKKEASKNTQSKELQMGVQMQRLGKKILEMHKVTKGYGELPILKDFDYIFKRQERVGIVGKNGVGKSTFLNLLTEQIKPDSGEIIKGETVSYGYYRQDGLNLPEDKRVVEVIQDIAEFAKMENGQEVSASQLLERFLFDRKVQYKYVSTLSGGEKRRLYLLTVLMQQPNFLILDEPTNDLDILTLNILEDFLQDFGGCLVVVTHDRFFLDKLVDHLLIFEGEGVIRDFNGRYDEYRILKAYEEEQAKQPKKETPAPSKEPLKEKNTATEKRKLSYKEQQEYQKLEKEIEQLEGKKEDLTKEMSVQNLSHQELQEKAEALGKIIAQVEQKTDRWLALAEFM
jgi:ATP-binding cassette subfamily F protein uup